MKKYILIPKLKKRGRPKIILTIIMLLPLSQNYIKNTNLLQHAKTCFFRQSTFATNPLFENKKNNANYLFNSKLFVRIMFF